MSQAAVPALAETRGCIVNFASIAVLHPGANLSAYSAAKGAVAAFTGALATELAPRGIRVNAIAPSTVRTAENIVSVGADADFVELSAITDGVMALAAPGETVTGAVRPITSRPG
jgi:NAD(P)-dependent dehydrogenase (short-subunit alcohol dehydrogenase family)